ncbi:MAG: hypothetical protein WCA29_03945 [Jiangellales bacterium]
MVAGAVVLALALLVAWPSGEQPGQAPPQPGSVASWPARGPDAQDSSVVRAVETAWRGVAEGSGIPGPGRDVDVLYLGDVDGLQAGLVRSFTSEGRLLVAAVVRGSDGWRVLDAVPLDTDVSWLTLPGGATSRVLAAPDVVAASSLALRRDDGVWNRVAIRDDGVTAPLRSLQGQPPILAVVGVRGAQRGLLEVSALSPTSIVPVGPPVQPRAPAWGRSGVLTAEEYDAALYALPVIPESAGSVAVIAAARVPGGRAVLVETRSAEDGGTSYLLVVPGEDGAPVVGTAPVVTGALAAGVVDRGGGRALVLAASAPSLARVEVRGRDGTTLVDGIGPTAVVLPAPAPAEVTVLGKRTNGSVVASIRVPLPPLSSPGP